MKKFFCFTFVFVIIAFCLSGCNFNSNVSGALAGDSQATPKVEQMMTALAESRIPDAKAFMHPDANNKPDSAYTQMSQYLSGRKTQSVQLININVKNSSGTAGNIRQEESAYKATLSDGTIVYLNVVYLTNDNGSGFSSFQLVLGAI